MFQKQANKGNENAVTQFNSTQQSSLCAGAFMVSFQSVWLISKELTPKSRA